MPEVLEAAEYFQIQELKELCGSVMEEKLCEANCLQFLNLAFRYNMRNLQKSAGDLLQKNKAKILKATTPTPGAVSAIPEAVRAFLGLE